MPLAQESRDLVLEHVIRAHVGLVRSYERDIERGIREMEAGVLAFEQLDERQREVRERIEQALGSTVGIQVGERWLALGGPGTLPASRFHAAELSCYRTGR